MATDSPELIGLSARHTRDSPEIVDLVGASDTLLVVNPITDESIGFEKDSISSGILDVGILINNPRIAYNPKFWSAQVAISDGKFNFGDSDKPIQVRYRKVWKEGDDTDPTLWNESQTRYKDSFDFKAGFEWVLSDTTMQTIMDIYKYWTLQRLIIQLTVTSVGFLLGLGDVVTLKNVPSWVIPSTFGRGIGSEGRRFQVVEYDKDYTNNEVGLILIDVEDKVLL